MTTFLYNINSCLQVGAKYRAPLSHNNFIDVSIREYRHSSRICAVFEKIDICFFAAIHQFQIKEVFIACSENRIPDFLSRWNLNQPDRELFSTAV